VCGFTHLFRFQVAIKCVNNVVSNSIFTFLAFEKLKYLYGCLGVRILLRICLSHFSIIYRDQGQNSFRSMYSIAMPLNGGVLNQLKW